MPGIGKGIGGRLKGEGAYIDVLQWVWYRSVVVPSRYRIICACPLCLFPFVLFVFPFVLPQISTPCRPSPRQQALNRHRSERSVRDVHGLFLVRGRDHDHLVADYAGHLERVAACECRRDGSSTSRSAHCRIGVDRPERRARGSAGRSHR